MYFSKLDGVFKHETILLLPACKVCIAVPFGSLELKKFAYLDDTVNLAGCNPMSIDGNCNVVLLFCVSPELQQS
jgi:hypothetical protein